MTRPSAPCFSIWQNLAGFCLFIFFLFHSAALRGSGPPPPAADTLLAACEALRQQGSPGAALACQQSVFDLLVARGGWKEPALAGCYREMGKSHYDLGDFPSALRMHKMSQEFLEQQTLPAAEEAAETYRCLGLTYTRLGIFDRAEFYLEKSLGAIGDFTGGYHPARYMTHSHLTDLYAAQGRLDAALEHNHLAIVHAFANFRTTDPKSLPGLTNHSLLAPAPELFLLLFSKARLFHLRYERNGQLSDLESAQAAYLAGDEWLDLFIRDSLRSVQVKNRIAPFYESGLETVYAHFGRTGEASVLQAAYWLMEKSRIALSRLHYPQATAQPYPPAPAALVQKEAALQSEIAGIRMEKAMGRSGAEERENALLQAYKELVRELDQSHPAYYQDKYKVGVEPFTEVRNALRKADIGMIGFFQGEKAIYALVLTNYKTPLVRVPLDFSPEQSPGDLYERLWKALPGNMPTRLVIVPSGSLCRVAFEALPTGNGKWLLESHAFSYAFSASEWLRAHREGLGKAEGGFLGVAPLYSTSAEFAPLASGRDEITEIREIMGGRLLLGVEATKKQFAEAASGHRWIHLGGYAAGCDSVFRQPWIGMSGEQPRLFLSDIASLRLDADMAVLSYAELGPELYPGPSGLLNIGRAFAVAGCPATVVSLWQPEPEANKALLEDFYQNLKNGMAKDEALRQAKIGWLEKNRDDAVRSHPRYWASLILTGKQSPIQHKPVNKIPWLLGAALGLVLLRIWWRWQQKRRVLRKIGRL